MAINTKLFFSAIYWRAFIVELFLKNSLWVLRTNILCYKFCVFRTLIVKFCLFVWYKIIIFTVIFQINFYQWYIQSLSQKLSPSWCLGCFFWWKQTFIWALQCRCWYKFISQVQPLCDGPCARGSNSEFFVCLTVQ